VRKVRIGFLVLVATFAAMSVSTGPAMGLAFHATEYTAEVTGQNEGEHVLTAEALTVKCKTATLAGELTEEREALELTPTYSECTASGVAATITTEGCKYKLNPGTKTMDIVCPAGKVIKIVSGTCEAQVGGQTGLSSVEYVLNEGPPETVTLKANLGKIKYTKTKDGFLCPFNGTGAKEDGTLTGQWALKATAAAEQVDFFFTNLCGEESTWAEADCDNWDAPTETEAELEAGWEEFEFEFEEEEAALNHDPILFIHGYRGSKGTWTTMINRFLVDKWAGNELWNWEYKWWISNVTIAEQVKKAVEFVQEKTGASKVDLITHSMGGLSSRYFIKFLMGGKEMVDDWVSLGGPNHGTTRATNCAKKYVSCVEMLPGSVFLGNLNGGGETPGKVSYGTWTGTWDFVIKPQSSTLMGGTAVNKVWRRVTHSGLHENAGVYAEVREFVK
jgi:triacylglycerol lipase